MVWKRLCLLSGAWSFPFFMGIRHYSYSKNCNYDTLCGENKYFFFDNKYFYFQQKGICYRKFLFLCQKIKN